MSSVYATVPSEEGQELRRCFSAMTTTIDLRVRPRAGQDQAATAALERAERFIRAAGRRLSRFCPNSEIGRLNRGERGRVSRQTVQVVSAALEAAAATGGLFDPTVLTALEAVGYDRTIAVVRGDTQRTVRPSPPLLGAFRAVTVDPVARVITMPPGVGLDLGGIAKGWLADTVARRLGQYGLALADIGGDMAVSGMDPGGNGWELDVENPFRPTPLAVLRMVGGGVATSGTLHRRWQTAHGWQHHLIDPRTGRPAVTDLAAVTVVAPTATAAEVAAKATLLLGAEVGRAALECSPGLAGLLVLSDGSLVTTSTLPELLIASEDKHERHPRGSKKRSDEAGGGLHPWHCQRLAAGRDFRPSRTGPARS